MRMTVTDKIGNCILCSIVLSSPKMLLLSVSYELRSRISNALIFEAVKDLGTLFLNLNSDIFVCFNY